MSNQSNKEGTVVSINDLDGVYGRIVVAAGVVYFVTEAGIYLIGQARGTGDEPAEELETTTNPLDAPDPDEYN